MSENWDIWENVILNYNYRYLEKSYLKIPWKLIHSAKIGLLRVKIMLNSAWQYSFYLKNIQKPAFLCILVALQGCKCHREAMEAFFLFSDPTHPQFEAYNYKIYWKKAHLYFFLFEKYMNELSRTKFASFWSLRSTLK